MKRPLLSALTASIAALGIVLSSAALGACASLRSADLVAASETVTYRVSFPAPQTQTVDVAMTFDTTDVEVADVKLPVWRPGRYEILDSAANVRGVRATNAAGDELAVRKSDKSTWLVETGGADEVTFAYTVYANQIHDRTRHVSPTHAFLSGSAVFTYTPRLRAADVRVELDLPEGWEIAGGLELAPGEPSVLVAPDYDVLVDSPLELGVHDKITFDVDGTPHEIVIWPKGVEHDAERMIEDFSKIVREQTAIFDHTPYARYVFLIHAGGFGGGTEHLNSTIMQTRLASIEGSVENDDAYKGFLSLVSHEFFHTFNVKQLRPAGIHPYDYQKENYSDLLWVAEGTTSYYSALTLARAGFTKDTKYFSNLASAIARQRDLPGDRVQSAAEASFDAWISGANSDRRNTQVSIYSKGSLVSLLLDMHLLRASKGKVSLDEVMRTMYERYPLSGPGYTADDLIAVANELSGGSFDDFFARYVSGTDPLPLEDALTEVGLELKFEPTKKKEAEDDASDSAGANAGDAPPTAATAVDGDGDAVPMKPFLGMSLDGGGKIRSLLATGPAYTAGFLLGDEVLALDDRRLHGDLDRRVDEHEPGDVLRFLVSRRDELMTIEVALAGVPDGKWTCKRVDEPTEAQKANYAKWLGAPWPGDEDESVNDTGTDVPNGSEGD